jgi:hypothetical protein
MTLESLFPNKSLFQIIKLILVIQVIEFLLCILSLFKLVPYAHIFSTAVYWSPSVIAIFILHISYGLTKTTKNYGYVIVGIAQSYGAFLSIIRSIIIYLQKPNSITESSNNTALSEYIEPVSVHINLVLHIFPTLILIAFSHFLKYESNKSEK